MTKDRDAQVIIRNLNGLSKTEHRGLLRWLRKVMADIEKRNKPYAKVANWSLMNG